MVAGMKPAHVFYLAGLCICAVFLVTTVWEFLLEDLVPSSMGVLDGPESTEERIEYVLTATAASAVVATLFSLIAFKAVSRHNVAEQALRQTLEDLEERVERRTADLRNANEALSAEIFERKHEEERFRRFFSLPLVGSAIYGPDKRWIAINDKLCDLLGYSHEELKELTWVDVTHPDDLAENLQLFEDARSGASDTYEMDKRFIRKDGDVLHTSISVECVRHPDGSPDYFMLLVQDLTDRKRAEAALRTGEERLRQAVQLSNLGYWVWDTQSDRCVFCSEEFARIHGTTVDEYMSGSSSLNGEFRFTHPDDRDEYRAACEALAAGREFDLEYRVITPQGETRHVREIAKPIIDENGSVVRAHGTIQDITKMKLAEAAIHERDESLRELQSQLIQSSRVSAMGQMSLGLAHELNQPLVAMVNYAGAAKRIIQAEGQISSKGSEAIDRAVEQAIQAGHIIRSLRRLFENRGINASSQDINETVSEGVTLALIGAKERKVKTELELAPDLPPAMIDRIQIQQVLLNLIRNSLEAMKDPACRELTIRTRRKDDAIELSVSDRGPGLPTDIEDRLFEPFVTTKPGGMGVGLLICNEIVQAHGGSIRGKTRPEGGAVFVVTLPIDAADQSEHARVA